MRDDIDVAERCYFEWSDDYKKRGFDVECDFSKNCYMSGFVEGMAYEGDMNYREFQKFKMNYKVEGFMISTSIWLLIWLACLVYWSANYAN